MGNAGRGRVFGREIEANIDYNREYICVMTTRAFGASIWRPDEYRVSARMI
jgi:hypothetical protein